MSGLLDFLLQDQNTGSQGLLGQLLNGSNGAGTQPVIPPGTPSPGYSAGPAQNYFRPRTGLLGDSILGDALRGGLAGLAGSTGYKGFGAQLGAGALSAEQNMQQRRQQQQGSLLGGQQYQSGQQSLIGGNISNIFALQRVNMLRAQENLPPLGMQDLLANPNLVNDPTGKQAQQQQNAAGPLNPVVQGGQPESTWVDQGQPQGAQQAQVPASGGTSDTTLQKLQKALQDAWIWAPDKVPDLEAKIAEYAGAPGQAAAVTAATGAATANTPAYVSGAVKDLASAYDATPAIKVMSDIRPTYTAVLASYKQASSATGNVPSDMDFLNGVLKMMNPDARTIRPGMADALAEAKGYPSYIQAAIQAVVGGTRLPTEVRDTLKQVADQHMAAYQSEYDTAVNNFRSRAKIVAPKAAESAWRSDMPSSAPASGAPPTISNAADYAALPSGTVYIDPNGNKRTKQ